MLARLSHWPLHRRFAWATCYNNGIHREQVLQHTSNEIVQVPP
jgi:hypothetical protein